MSVDPNPPETAVVEHVVVARRGGAREWVRTNLFRTPLDAAMTIVFGLVGGYVLYRFLRFVLVTGRWTIVKRNLSLYLKGQWPDGDLWRLVVAGMIIGAGAGLVAGYIGGVRDRSGLYPAPPSGWRRVREISLRLWPLIALVVGLLLLSTTIGPWVTVLLVLVSIAVGRAVGERLPDGAALILAAGLVAAAVFLVWFLTRALGWDGWGGMILNVYLAVISITLCFPLGVLLALGRRSEFPIVRGIATVYIEGFRGLPLLPLLLMANVALGFFVPQSLTPGKVVRAIIIFTLFTAAYIAEIVRGGLQSVPRGQFEAARALGLSPITTTFRIVLPQALRNVIPAIVGQFISLFKDTTLAGAAMGFTDLLSAASASTKQSDFQGQGVFAEAGVFVLLLFWVGSYTMSRESQRLESRLGVGER
ncbi:MAG: amino acid ABC transporter permease [Ilumatobacteraceae bacterium]